MYSVHVHVCTYTRNQGRKWKAEAEAEAEAENKTETETEADRVPSLSPTPSYSTCTAKYIQLRTVQCTNHFSENRGTLQNFSPLWHFIPCIFLLNPGNGGLLFGSRFP